MDRKTILLDLFFPIFFCIASIIQFYQNVLYFAEHLLGIANEIIILTEILLSRNVVYIDQNMNSPNVCYEKFHAETPLRKSQEKTLFWKNACLDKLGKQWKQRSDQSLRRLTKDWIMTGSVAFDQLRDTSGKLSVMCVTTSDGTTTSALRAHWSIYSQFPLTSGNFHHF